MDQPLNPTERFATLAPRELDILRLLSEGLSNREIAERLYFTLQTVKWYNRQVYDKLAVGNRTEATKLALDEGFFSTGADDRSPQTTHQLPKYLTRFIGRQQEIDAVKSQLQHAQLVTVTGVGGTGKTRLCVEIAHNITADYKDGVYFVSLASISDGSMVAATIAQTLNIGAPSDKPAHAYVTDYLRDKNMLLVIDNFEHLIEQKGLLATFLRAAPDLSILVTSREVLHLDGEEEYSLDPIALPPPFPSIETILESDAVALFIDRMMVGRASTDLSNNDLETIAQICIRLDGLPLAIELAAARHRLLSLNEILHLLSNRLVVLKGGARDLAARQQTLRATIDWGYELLSADEKVLFANLSVFRGGATFEAIQAVCGEGLADDFDFVEGLTALVDKSLITYDLADEVRFSMLATLGEYGQECLSAENRLFTLQQRHAEYLTAYFAEFSTVVPPNSESMSPSIDVWSIRMSNEHDNLQAVMRWCLEQDRIDLAARLMVLTAWRWNLHPSIHEWLHLGEQIMARGDSLAPSLRALAMVKIGFHLTHYCVSSTRGLELVNHAIPILREFGTKEELAHGLIVSKSPSDVQESLEIFTEINDLTFMAWAHSNLGEFARHNEDYPLAKSHYQRALRLADAADFHTVRSLSRLNLAHTLLYLDDLISARHLLVEAATITCANHDYLKTAYAMGLFGVLAVALGNYQRAPVLFGAMDNFNDLMGTNLEPIDELTIAHYQAEIRNILPPDEYTTAWERGRGMSLAEATAFAHDS